MSQLPDGSRQISATGPYYRGPGAPAAGPIHHYLFELFALDTMLDVPAVGASPPNTRAAVIAAMAGHVASKGIVRRPVQAALTADAPPRSHIDAAGWPAGAGLHTP